MTARSGLVARLGGYELATPLVASCGTVGSVVDFASVADLTVYGARRPLHSGHYGNWAPNPAMQLAQLLASMKDDHGRVLVDGFYDQVTPLTEAEQTGAARLTGTSAVMQRLRDQIAKLARSQAPIYVSGESGSGKEVAARLVHELGPRADEPFVPVNCGAIPSELMESEFFGHVKGSFTGAVADKVGLSPTPCSRTIQ